VGTRVVYEEFHNFGQLLETINGRPKNAIMEGRNDSETNSEYFTGTKSYKQACEMLGTGYIEILQRLEKSIAAQNKLNAKYTEELDRPRPSIKVQGYIPCIPNAIRNLPQSMISIDRKPIKRKTLHILYAETGSGAREAEWFIAAGAALLSAIEIIEKGGIQTKIDLCFFCGERAGEITFPTITIKNYGERYSLQKISFPLAHPSMFRRIGFKWLETTPDIRNDFSVGYGRAPTDEELERALGKRDNSTYLITTDWINRNDCSVEEILKKFEVI
jgi:hypothetical protein